MTFRFLGTGNAAQVPVYGCDCRACQLARENPKRRRGPCSALLEDELTGYRLLLDAGLQDLPERFPAGSLDAILLTHYHMDHVAGLFALRWGRNLSIPVYGPDDPKGCDDLFKHPGILDFRSPLIAFDTLTLGPWRITPLPLFHSKPTLGYRIESADQSLAYLTDTVGLPTATRDYLMANPVDDLILDCSFPPRKNPPRNHNDWNLALEICNHFSNSQIWFTHIGHELDNWLLSHDLKQNINIASDNTKLA